MSNDHNERGHLSGGGDHQRRFRVAVAAASFDFRDLEISDPVPTGRQLLEAGGFRPVEEHLLFQLLESGALEERRLDETAGLRRDGVERFIAFRSDRSFRFEADDRRFEWGADRVTGHLIKLLAGVDPKSSGVWLERRDEPDLFVGDEDAITLTAEGLERFRTGPIFVLCIESKEIPWPKPTITTEEIAALGNWDPNLGVQEVNLMTGEARTLAPGEVVELQPGKGFCKKIGWRRG